MKRKEAPATTASTPKSQSKDTDFHRNTKTIQILWGLYNIFLAAWILIIIMSVV
jgi:hypothetical protein